MQRYRLILYALLLFVLPMMAQTQLPTSEAKEHEDAASELSADSAVFVRSLTEDTPEDVTTEVEYRGDNYLIHTKIGNMDIATPILMTPAEYSDYSLKLLMQDYWREKIGKVEHDNERKFDITDMKFNIGPADKVFGPGGVQLKLQGSAELLFGFNHQFIDNPSLTKRSRTNNVFDFDEKIQLNVTGKVGEKLNFNMNYNTEASFDFDRQNIKLNYKGTEDDIIQSIEAGNVTMNLNSQLIRGSQALFGFKTDLKFGKLKIQALLSQQNSQSQSVSSQGGAQMTKFEVNATNYDENRHFFLSHYFRDTYEKSLAGLPYIASGVTINRIEVWVTNKRGQYEQARNIVAFVDLAEASDEHIQNAYWSTASQSTKGGVPYNRANGLYEEVTSMPGVRDIQQTNAVLGALSAYGIDGGEDYEKIESARMLNSSEYTLNATLGYISLRSALNQDEVLCVAYEYTYNGQVYQVGEFSTDASDNLRAPNALILKMLKSGSNQPLEKGKGTWDLMMKNVYSLGAMQMTSEKFELYVMYRNDSVGTDLQYLTEGQIANKQLLRVMLLDRLDQKNNTTPDGRFDYVEGYTAISQSGRIIFPVLEPFGSHLRAQIGNDAIADKYCFQELYDSTLVVAEEMSEKNKFVLTGKYKGSSGSEIRLNAMNIPRGSVVVTAGGATLTENVDYTVDYTMGTVTILNQSILESGTNVDVRLENQSTYSMQRKSLMGTHLEYEFSKDFVIGGTLMHMVERPLTTKVNTGQEPLNNTIWGANLSWKKEFQWLSNWLDQVPWITATQPSSIQVNAEFAQIIPGHTREVGKVGKAYIDDFEATKTNIDVHYPNFWRLSSTPSRFDESRLSNNLEYGKNRARIAWFTVDPIFGNPQTNTPQHIRDDLSALSDHRTRIIYEQEIYPNKEVLANEDTRLAVLNVSYYPQERGPYNIVADEIGADGLLTHPEQRWGGMMRKLDNTDFETSNIEYIEFWLMDPFVTNPDPNYAGGDLYFNLGDISEDILKDGKKSFEHGLPVTDADGSVETTIWGRVPKTTSTVTAFSNESGAREKQDVGLNGLSTAEEMLFEYNGIKPYADYVNALMQKVDAAVLSAWRADPFSPLNDPAGDNYHYYRGSDYDQEQVPILDRYKYYNGTEGNSPATENSRESYGTASTLIPDIEDINSDNTLNEYEKYYEYHIELRRNMMEVGRQHITEKFVTRVKLKNGETEEIAWYQFKIPVRQYDQKVGNIRNFKSIRFMRMYLTGFQEETYLRFASLDLVRGEWRTYTKSLYPEDKVPQTQGGMSVEAVNIEENASRTPVNYVLPPGISRQTDPGQAQLIAQNEQAMVLRVIDLSPEDARAVYKNVSYDMRNYKNLQLFVHAESLPTEDLADGELTCFIRLGTDLKNNYYEYEIPLRLTPDGLYNNDNENDRLKVWPAENMFDFPLEVLTNAKMQRNTAKRAGNAGVGNTIPYVIYDDASGKPDNRITVMGNPTIGEVEAIMIGIRNRSNRPVSGEVWVNELRMSEFNEKGGVAALANVALGISDIAQVNVAGRLETAGYGAIESNVLSRNMDNQYQLSVSAALEAGRLFPEKAQLQIPLYVAYTNQTISPEFDPLDTDVRLQDNLESYETKAEKDSVKLMSRTVQTSTNFSVSNAKINIHSKKRNMFYDPANFSLSYSRMEQNEHTPEMEKNYQKDDRGSFTYQYTFNPTPWEPFKSVKKVEKLKWLKEWNLYYLPQSWSFRTDMNRSFSHMKMRDFSGEIVGVPNAEDLTFSKDWMWNRNVDFRYDLTKNLKFTFTSGMNSTVDETLLTPEIVDDYKFEHKYYEAWKDTVLRSLRTMGRPYQYQQTFTASYNVPFNRFGWFDWITANGSYTANYNWNRTATSANQETDLGNTISSMQSWQADGSLNFENLYNKSKYAKQTMQRFSGRGNKNKRFREKTFTKVVDLVADSVIEIKHNLNADLVNITVTTETGREIAIKSRITSKTAIELIPKKSMKGVTVKVVTKDPSTRTPAQTAGDMAAYFGMLLRKVQVTYRETNSLVVPGFVPEAGFMGQNYAVKKLYAPGFDYAFGFIPNDFLERAKQNGWLSGDTTVVQPATRAKTADMDIKLTLEPFPGFKIQVSGKRYAAESASIIYSYDRMQETLTGSFNITTIAAKTAFQRIAGEEQNYASQAFTDFLANRDIIAGRLQETYNGLHYPDAGFLNGTIYGGKPYSQCNGTVGTTSADVLVPAFLSAYLGRDANRVSVNPFMSILNILPNWSVTFDGLTRIPWVKDHFRTLNITHAYTCKYAIQSYSSYSTWVPAIEGQYMYGFVRDVETEQPLPSSAYDIQGINITEQFSPLIGVNATMKNSLNCKIEYRKQRNLGLNVSSVQLTEGHTNELVIGIGYTIKDFDVILKLKGDKTSRVKNDLKLNCDVSYKDIKTLLRKIEENITQASSGNKVLGIKVSLDYVLSAKVNLQLFYEHQGTTPIISSSYPIKADNVGLNIKLMLTR